MSMTYPRPPPYTVVKKKRHWNHRVVTITLFILSIPTWPTFPTGANASPVPFMIPSTHTLHSSMVDPSPPSPTPTTITASTEDDAWTSIEQWRQRSTELRTLAKELHDQGDFITSEEIFHQAASTLETALSFLQNNNNNKDTKNNQTTTLAKDDLHSFSFLQGQVMEECATCRLHEALCQHKQKKFIQSIQTCSQVLGDSFPTHNNTTTTTTSTTSSSSLSAAVQARAYLRRAKAFYALAQNIQQQEEESPLQDDTTFTTTTTNQTTTWIQSAYQDARTAAFLGDVNAVNFYGRLMRNSSTTPYDSSASASSSSSTTTHSNPLFFPSEKSSGSHSLWGVSSSQPPQSSSPLSSLLFPSSSSFLSTHDAKSSSSSLDMFSMLGVVRDFISPSSKQQQQQQQQQQGGKSNSVQGVQTLIHSLVSKLESKETQQVICQYLQSIQSSQIQSLASLVGIPMESSMALKLVTIAHKISPRGIQQTLILLKRCMYVGKMGWKCIRVIHMYRHLLVYYMLIQFIQRSMKPIKIQ